MKNQILTLMVSIAIFTMSPAFAMEGPEEQESSCLSVHHSLTSPENQAKSDAAFSALLHHSSSENWRFNGGTRYGLADVCQIKLAHHLMITNPNQKEFNFVELGAGEFQHEDHWAEQINSFNDISPDVRVNIIGMRAEKYRGEICTTVGKCKIFKLGKFNIENMEAEEEKFKKKYFTLTNNVDVMITSWTLRHLVNPVKTVRQAANLLKEKTGLFFGDGFTYGYKGQSVDDLHREPCFENFNELILNLKMPFLIQPYQSTFNQFVVRRDTSDPIELPLKYYGMVDLGANMNGSYRSGVATLFEHVGPRPQGIGESPVPWNLGSRKLCGNLDLFNFFEDNDLFDRTLSGLRSQYNSFERKL